MSRLLQFWYCYSIFKILYWCQSWIISRYIHQGEQSSDGDPDDDLLVLVDLVPELGQAALEVVHVLRALRVLDALAILIKQITQLNSLQIRLVDNSLYQVLSLPQHQMKCSWYLYLHPESKISFHNFKAEKYLELQTKVREDFTI